MWIEMTSQLVESLSKASSISSIATSWRWALSLEVEPFSSKLLSHQLASKCLNRSFIQAIILLSSMCAPSITALVSYVTFPIAFSWSPSHFSWLESLASNLYPSLKKYCHWTRAYEDTHKETRGYWEIPSNLKQTTKNRWWNQWKDGKKQGSGCFDTKLMSREFIA